QVRRIDKGTCEAELGDEGIETSSVRGIEGPCGGRKISRGREPGHVSVAERVHRDAVGLVEVQTAQIGRIAQDRIDRQWAAGIIRGYFKANLTRTLKYIPAGDVLLLASCFLVDARSAEPNLPSPSPEHQIAARVHADFG